MKILYSYVVNKNAPYQCSLQLAALSNFLAQHNGFETEFWGDEESLYLFKNIKYNHFKKLDTNKLSKLPPSLWSMSKLLAIRNTYEPFLHFDCDILLFKYLSKYYQEKDILCLNNENFFDQQYAELQNIYGIKPKQSENQIIRSYNCGILGGKDYETFHKSIDIIFKYIEDNYTYMENIANTYSRKVFSLFFPPVLVEQIWLFQIIKSFNKDINEIGMPYFKFPDNIFNTKINYNDFIHYGLIHLMNDKKNLYDSVIELFLKENNITY